MTNDDPEEMVALNELTGIAHRYAGTMPNRFGQIELIPCGCEDTEWFEEAEEHDALTMIHRKHAERGIWELAECLQDDA